MPVLFYCTSEVKAYIQDQGQAFISADYGDTDEKALRLLAERDQTGVYKLVLATHAEAMRGVDYRAPAIGITLLVGKSFENAREADQGLKRVGRQKDPCQRVAIEGIPLIDPV